jgi:hypothetical protein
MAATVSPMQRRYRSVMIDSGRWDQFQPRAGDIVISTPPKCGTTWMQMICALLVFQDPELPRPLSAMSRWVDVLTEPIDDVIGAYEAQAHRRFIKTHTPLDGLPDDDRFMYVCVGRDLRDVAMSWDDHFANMNLAVAITSRANAVGLDGLEEFLKDGIPERPEDPVERFWAWVDEDLPVGERLTSLKGSLHHLGTFWDARDDPRVVMVHYADLMSDLDGQMRRLAAALGFEIDEEKWPALVEAARFDSMRSRADTLVPQSTIDGFWNDIGQFFNRARSGEWRSFLDGDATERYRARVRELSAPDLTAWVHQETWPAP